MAGFKGSGNQQKNGNNWARGARPPARDRAAALAKALGTSIDYLISGRGSTGFEGESDADVQEVAAIMRRLPSEARHHLVGLARALDVANSIPHDPETNGVESSAYCKRGGSA